MIKDKNIMINSQNPRDPSLADDAAQRLFHLLDRCFWLIWLAFPFLIWFLARQVLDAPALLAALSPENAACLKDMPMIENFSTQGRAAFWALFGFDVAFYVLLLGLTHSVIHRCAAGQVFVASMIGTLRQIGIVIAAYPPIALVLGNLVLMVFVVQGDVAVFQPELGLDLPVIAVGLLLVTMAAAMQMAVRLHQDAELTI